MQLQLLHHPLKRSHFITFSIVTLLVIFGAIWFGFFLARNITVPIQAPGLRHPVRGGRGPSVQLDSDRQDEIGMLMSSFNKMVRDLREGREQLANAYDGSATEPCGVGRPPPLHGNCAENIAAGVVSVDAEGHIVTMNNRLKSPSDFRPTRQEGRHYSEFLQPPHMEIVKSFMESYRLSSPALSGTAGPGDHRQSPHGSPHQSLRAQR